MREIIFVCEGHSEEEFVNRILRPYFLSREIYEVRPILMSTSKGHVGGDIKYDRLKFNLDRLLHRPSDVLVTTFIDFFRLRPDFPGYDEAQRLRDKNERVAFLEQALGEAINHQRFIPYIQMHEFEGLLFTATNGFETLPGIPHRNLRELVDMVFEKENPEELNDGENTAPSKRLARLIPGFDKNKPLYGGLIAQENNIESILARCTRFQAWIETLIQRFRA